MLDIAVPSSIDIGRVFANAGAKHVLCYDDTITASRAKLKNFGEEDLTMLSRFRFNYIFNFGMEFFKGIISE